MWPWGVEVVYLIARGRRSCLYSPFPLERVERCVFDVVRVPRCGSIWILLLYCRGLWTCLQKLLWWLHGSACTGFMYHTNGMTILSLAQGASCGLRRTWSLLGILKIRHAWPENTFWKRLLGSRDGPTWKFSAGSSSNGPPPLFLNPLVEEGILKIYTAVFHTCNHCSN